MAQYPQALSYLGACTFNQRVLRIGEMFSEGVETEEPSTPQRRRQSLTALKASPRLRLRALWRSLIAARRRESAAAFAPAASLLLRHWLRGANYLPNSGQALVLPNGLCGLAGSLNGERLMEIYGRGLYPKDYYGLTTLWSPALRAVAQPEDLARMAFTPCQRAARVTLDLAFDKIFAHCVESGLPDWNASIALGPTFGALFEAGFAHSLEVWDKNGQLIAGAIGLANGAAFTIEALFAESEEALKTGLRALGKQLRLWDFALVDFKASSVMSASLHCHDVKRATFEAVLSAKACGGRHGRWRMEPSIGQTQTLRSAQGTGPLPFTYIQRRAAAG